MSLRYDPRVAIARLRRADRELGRVIDRVGGFALRSRAQLTPFQALLRAIVYQQLSGVVASRIHARVLAAFPRRYATPARLLALPEESLREAGLSRAKVAAARDLAARTLDGLVPDGRRLRAMGDDAIVERVIGVRGIGRWTVEMLLIFHLGRPDVLPATDLGVRRGYLNAFGGEDLPEPAEVLARGERWRPYRSVASWYLWRASEF